MKLHNTLFQSVLLAANTGGATGPAEIKTEARTKGQHTAKTWETTLKAFRGALTNTKKYALELALMSIEHFRETGDLVYAQSFFDECQKHGKNFVRIEAYKAWLGTFSPVKFEKNKFLKDKERATAEGWYNYQEGQEPSPNPDMWDRKVELDVDGVKKSFAYDEISFWDFMPEAPVEHMDSEALLAMLVKKLESKKTVERVAGDANAEANREALLRHLKGFKLVDLAQAEGQQAA